MILFFAIYTCTSRCAVKSLAQYVLLYLGEAFHTSQSLFPVGMSQLSEHFSTNQFCSFCFNLFVLQNRSQEPRTITDFSH